MPNFLSEMWDGGKNLIAFLDYAKTIKISAYLRQIRRHITYRLVHSLDETYLNEQEKAYLQTIVTKWQKIPLAPDVAAFFDTVQSEGVPFLDFEHEPSTVSQLKKLINALYHTEVSFTIVEGIDYHLLSYYLSFGAELALNVGKLQLDDRVSQLIYHAYEAAHLATHPDVDIYAFLKPHLCDITALYRTSVEHFTGQSLEEAEKSILETHQLADLAPQSRSMTVLKLILQSWLPDLSVKQIGQGTGQVLDNMRPCEGPHDFAFTTRLSGQLPEYIRQTRNYIQQYVDGMKSFEPGLSEKQIEELTDASNQLLTSIEEIQDQEGFSIKLIVNYVDTLKRLVTVGYNIVQELQQLNGSTQAVIAANLRRIKFQIIPEFLALVDEAEVLLMLRPGTLSQSIVETMEQYYYWLSEYCQYLLPFENKHAHFKAMIDDDALACRLAKTYQRIGGSREALVNIKLSDNAWHSLVSLLNKPPYQGQALASLSSETKQALIKNYKFVQSYVAKLAPDLDEAIVKALKSQLPKASYFDAFSYNINYYLGRDLNSQILALDAQIQALIAKDKASHSFRIQGNEQAVTAITEQSLPLMDKSVPLVMYTLPETNFWPLKKTWLCSDSEPDDDELFNPELEEQYAKDYLQHREQTQHQRLLLKQALNAYRRFEHILKINQDLNMVNIAQPTKGELRHLYRRFRPFLAAVLTEKIFKYWDATIVDVLNAPSNRDYSKRHNKTFGYFQLEQLTTVFNQRLSYADNLLKRLSEYYLSKSKSYLTKECWQRPIKVATKAYRRHALLKTTQFSQKIAYFRDEAKQLVVYLAPSLRRLLQPAKQGMPFPEIEIESERFKQPGQVLSIKRVFNILYHLELILNELENIDERSPKVLYVTHLIYAYMSFQQIEIHAMESYQDVHLRWLYQNITRLMNEVSASFFELIAPYQVPPQDVRDNKGIQLSFGGIWYGVNALYYWPAHLRDLSKVASLTQAQATHLHCKAKKATGIIEGSLTAISSLNFSAVKDDFKTGNIINGLGKFKKLVQGGAKISLLLLPVYYTFNKLKDQFNHLTTTSYEITVSTLQTLKTQIISEELAKLDELEDGIGLKPGLLSEPMMSTLLVFYNSLINELNLSADEKLALIADMSWLQVRKQDLTDKENKALIEKDALYAQKMHLESALTVIKDCLEQKTVSASQKKSLYKLVLPFFDSLGIEHKALSTKADLIRLLEIHTPEESAFHSGTEATEGAMDNSPPLTVRQKYQLLENALKARYAKQIGRQATIGLRLAIIEEKKAYFQTQEAASQTTVNQAKEAYVAELYENYANQKASRPLPLYNLKEEYQAKLASLLNQTDSKEAIIMEVLFNHTVNVIQQRIDAKVKAFDQDNLSSFRKLEKVSALVYEFSQYISVQQRRADNAQTSFENEYTLNAKNLCLTHLNRLLSAKDKSPKERVQKMQRLINKKSFRDAILQTPTHVKFSWNWIKQWFYSLACTLGICRSTTKTFLQEIKIESGLMARPEGWHLTFFGNIRHAKAKPDVETEEKTVSQSLT
jgi:hypothetical protein